MIVADKKPIEEVIDSVRGFKQILIAGCNECVTVCEAGGKKEVGILASAMRMNFMNEGKKVEIDEVTLERQCDHEYLEELRDTIDRYDAVVSLACGVGVQFMAEKYRKIPVYPGIDTNFIGVAEEQGVWTERCQACGDCKLHLTGGICPITRCVKSILNGPCGGSVNGKCEVNPEVDCGWQLIYDVLKEQGRLDKMEEIIPINDWTTSRDGGPRKIIREDMKL